MRVIEPIYFDEYIENFCQRKKDFIIETKRSTHTMFLDGGAVFMSKRSKKKKVKKNNHKAVINLFATVQKSINKYIVDSDFTVEKVKEKCSSTKTDKSKWDGLGDGEIFYYVDINHCYWRVAFLNGYISERVYSNILKKTDLKVERNMSLAMIIAPKKRKYYKDGKILLEIQEEKTIYKTIYNNIRYTAYNLMGDCMKLSGSSFIAYRTDGIMLTEEAVDDVVELITSKGFDCTIQECSKINSKQYMDNKGKEINF